MSCPAVRALSQGLAASVEALRNELTGLSELAARTLSAPVCPTKKASLKLAAVAATFFAAKNLAVSRM